MARPQVFLFERSSSVHLLVLAYVPTLFCAHLEERQDSVSQPGSVIFQGSFFFALPLTERSFNNITAYRAFIFKLNCGY